MLEIIHSAPAFKAAKICLLLSRLNINQGCHITTIPGFFLFALWKFIADVVKYCMNLNNANCTIW
jgi:hypothetical protein